MISRLLVSLLALNLLAGYTTAKTHGTHPPVDRHHAHEAARHSAHPAGEHAKPPKPELAYHPRPRKAKPHRREAPSVQPKSTF